MVSSANCLVINSSLFSPYRQWLSFTLVREIRRSHVIFRIWPSIVSLFFPGSPSAITWLVVAVILNSFYGHTFWRLPHISKKRNERFFPSFTNLDASSPIVSIGRNIGISTSIQHVLPNSINTSTSQAVSSFTVTSYFDSAASTRKTNCIHKCESNYFAYSPASAFAQPSNSRISVWFTSFLKNNPKSIGITYFYRTFLSFFHDPIIPSNPMVLN